MLGKMLKRRAVKVTVGVEPYDGRDGQGAPSYAASQNISARVVEEDDVVISGDGTEVRTRLTVFVPQGQSPVPSEQDRLTYDGRTFIAVEKKQARRINGDIVHHRTRARDE